MQSSLSSTHARQTASPLVAAPTPSLPLLPVQASNDTSSPMPPSPRPTEGGGPPSSPPPADPCENCTSCVRGATAFGQTLAGVEPSSYAKAREPLCCALVRFLACARFLLGRCPCCLAILKLHSSWTM